MLQPVPAFFGLTLPLKVISSIIRSESENEKDKTSQIFLQPMKATTRMKKKQLDKFENKTAGGNLSSFQNNIPIKAVDNSYLQQGINTISQVYHQNIYGISVGTVVLAIAILALVVFVLYAKYRSSEIYRVCNKYERAYDRMIDIMVSYNYKKFDIHCSKQNVNAC